MLPVYFGLAIVVEEERLAGARPSSRRSSTASRAPRGKDELLELAESVRLRAMLFQHNVFRQR